MAPATFIRDAVGTPRRDSRMHRRIRTTLARGADDRAERPAPPTKTRRPPGEADRRIRLAHLRPSPTARAGLRAIDALTKSSSRTRAGASVGRALTDPKRNSCSEPGHLSRNSLHENEYACPAWRRSGSSCHTNAHTD